MDFGQNIKRIRLEKSLTQTQLSVLAKTRIAQISIIERNLTDPKYSTIIKIANALDIPIPELLKVSNG